MSIKLKLIIIFIFIKIIPLLIITYIGIKGVIKLNDYFVKNTELIYLKNEEIIKNTAYNSINDSIEALDDKSQELIEKITVEVAKKVATFLYERDSDILFLSKLDISQEVLENFYNAKQKEIIDTPSYEYNSIENKWVRTKKKEIPFINEMSKVPDNKKNFRYIDTVTIKKKFIPIYKEISYFDLLGKEVYKKSSINNELKDLSKKENTYIKAETFFSEIKTLKEGEIYVSEVIGEYVPSKVIGVFNKKRTDELGLEFAPEKHAYAGVENPLGKKFDGIIRFITPVYKNKKKLAYISLLLDHKHIMEYTDTLNPSSGFEQIDISDASIGNYGFMWDYKGRNISHPRDYFIVGFDAQTGERVPGWISKSLADEFKSSKEKDLNRFLDKYPKFYKQSLKEKANLEQLRERGEVGLDCQYLNFAPQCKGWMELTHNGGYGSFIIYWSNVWKLTTAATIPYYTGQYKDSKRGFGFVTIGANVDEFHSAANKTRENINGVISSEVEQMNKALNKNKEKIYDFILVFIEDMTVYTFLMIIFVLIIAFWMSNYISEKIIKLIKGTQEFSKNNLKYRIEVTSKDEIGKLENSFNEMAKRLEEDTKKIEEQHKLMAQQSKMASMGEMLGNIAHQWRQPLSIISSCASAIRLQNVLDTVSKEEINNSMDKINKSTQYLSETIEDFRNFFDPRNSRKSEFSTSSLIEKTLNLIGSQLTSNQIEVIQNIEDFKVISLENELIQVLVNILNNSKDVLMSLKNQRKIIFINTYVLEDKLVIEIKDNAGGIKDDIIDRIFEPYFTTKHKSQGTGIGLYMSDTIIRTHLDGSIIVKNVSYNHENVKYKGAKFVIEIGIEE